jgi:RNA polymerase sigma factor (sigma-70 family)
MKITDPGADTLHAATAGDLQAIDQVLTSIQGGVFHLAMRMLGQREDAADATQEILLKVVTHLGGFRADAAFPTWVFQIARNHLLTASTRQRESPEVSLEGLAARLQMGLEFGASLGDPLGAQTSLSPEDKAQAHELALSCTQTMLMTLDREQRLSYVLDAVFGLSSNDAAQVLGITAAAYRQRLARARAALEPFMQETCGLVNPRAACRCDKQLPASRYAKANPAAAGQTVQLQSAQTWRMQRAARAQAEQDFQDLVRLSDAAALFRSQAQDPNLRDAPAQQLASIRAVLRSAGYMAAGPTTPLQ